CQTNWDECWSNPCQNGGSCIDGVATYNCSCPEGFIVLASPESTASTMWPSATQLKRFAATTEENASKDWGWAGPKCEEQIDECKSNPCQNGGICIDVHADYMCACTYGFTGKSCEVQIEFCDDNSCRNGALCVVEDGERICYCVPDFHGDRCELQYDECLLGPRCLNGGTCIDGVDNFTCSCPPRLTGNLCECLILDDETQDCEYVSPSPNPIATTLLSLPTEITTFISTSESLETISSNLLNVTTGPDKITTQITEPSYTTDMSSIITNKELTTSMTTTSEEYLTNPDTTTEIITFKIQTEGSPEADNAKTETTSACSDKRHNNITTVKMETFTDIFDNTPITTVPYSINEITTTKKFVYQDTTTNFSEQSTTTNRPSPAITTLETTQREQSTIKIDATTEKLFTEKPTVVLNFTTVTEGFEGTTSTPFDTTTSQYSTEQPECTNSICNNRGTCYNSLHGMRCHCIFNYSGRFCEEKLIIKSAAFGANSFIIHRVRNDTTINIQFDAKTLISDGKIMHVDIAKGVYMELYLNMGLLKFEFSCGYQTMLLSEVKTFVNKGHPMRIETRLDFYLNEQHCNATLHLNDTVAMSGGQVNGERREVFNDALSAADITECSSLVCLSTPCSNGGTCRSHADGYVCACANGWMGVNCNQSVCENNPCQYGGSCVRNPGSGFLCLCPFGKHGIFCEYNVEITRPSLAPVSSGISSFIIFPLSSAAVNSDRFDLRLRFQSEDMDQIALLAFVGQNGHHDSKSQHLALTFVKGYVMVTWNMGGGSRRIFTSRPLSARRGGHTVRVWRRGRTAGLTIDGRHNVSGNAPANDNKMNILPYLYIGGHPSKDFHTLPHDLPLHSGWKGCIWEVGGQAIATGNSVGGRGVGQCGVAQCTVKSCNAPRGVCIHSPATYGCICNEGWFGATCSSKVSPCDYSETNCNGRCVITAGSPQCDCPYGKIGTNCDKDITPTDLMFPGIRSYVRLHPRSISSVSLSLEADIKPNKERGLVMYVETPHFYTALSLQGGVRAGRYRSRLYVWLDGALTTEPMLAHAYPHTASEASIILGGAADLSHLPFDVMSGPPESFAGCLKNFHVNNIQQSLDKANIADITISVPQFDGDAMISLSRSIAGRNEDMTTLPKVPNYLALNFTTAEPNGLLIWIKMGVDYIGVGLENGYMRLVGSSHCSNGEARTKPKIMSQIIKSSFMADGGITEHDDDTIRKIFPQNFRGCIDSLSTQEESYISNFTNIYSENVKICQQFLPERT
ncbi:unnamed protein product, partial [Leptidea sinapis]